MLKQVQKATSKAVTAALGSSCAHRRGSKALTATIEESARPPSQGGSGNFLVTRAVRLGTKDAYLRMVALFLGFCMCLSFMLDTPEKIDAAMVALNSGNG